MTVRPLSEYKCPDPECESRQLFQRGSGCNSRSSTDVDAKCKTCGTYYQEHELALRDDDPDEPDHYDEPTHGLAAEIIGLATEDGNSSD